MKAKDLLKQANDNYPSDQIAVLEDSIKFATEYHLSQKRLSGEEYITHPLSVASLLIEWRLDMESVVAGVLHDTLEDTEATPEIIEERFGKEVAFLVDGVTKVGEARSGMRSMDTYLPKTSDNLSKLLIAVCSDLRVMLIKLADRLHNLRTIEHLSPTKQKKIASESLKVFAPLADRIGMGRVRVEIEDIAFKILEPKRYEDVSKQLKAQLGATHKQQEKIRRDLLQALKQEGIEFKLDGRTKSVYSLQKKLVKEESVEEVYDLFALRIVVETKEDCYRVLGIVHSLYQPMIKRIKDYISVPKPNGYQSLHTTVITPYETIVEIQIRTEAMHAFAERGLAASFFYNEQKVSASYIHGKAAELPRNLKWINQLQEKVNQYMENPHEDHVDLGVDLFTDRIFVYSPNGDIYDMPEGSTALDFAYYVHSDIGDHAMGAKINNKMGKLASPLQNGDFIEIITAKNVKPKDGWLKVATTERARHKIRSTLRKLA